MLSHTLNARFCTAYERSVCLACLSAWPCWLDCVGLLFLSVLHRLCCLTYWLPPCLTIPKCPGICQWIHNVVGQAHLSVCVEFYGAEPVVWNWSKLLSGLTMIHSQREREEAADTVLLSWMSPFQANRSREGPSVQENTPTTQNKAPWASSTVACISCT